MSNAMPTAARPPAPTASRGGQTAPGSDGAIRIEVRLTRDPIRPMDRVIELNGKEVDGAWAEFTGLVRGEEDGQPIEALEYEAYESMAPAVIRSILTRLAQQHPSSAVGVIHRLGLIPVGEAAIWVGVASRHRREAFALLTGFMDELKRDVPIWKRRALVAAPKA